MEKIIIEFGALVPEIHKQLEKLNMEYAMDKIYACQGDADAITRLMIRGFISDSVGRNARKKILKNIIKAIKKEAL